MMARQKPIPSNTSNNTIPPNENYVYFEGYHEEPFQYDARGEYQRINAWWLAEAAFLAYAEPPFARPRFRDAGFVNVEYFSAKSTQCYVAHNDDFVIVAFRGSEIRQRAGTNGRDIRYIIADWWVDLGTDLVDSGQGGSVHKGFKTALDEVWNHLKPYLDSVLNENGHQRPVWFTGHSLGAALATLAAVRHGNAAELYTFGSPRVGDRAFAEGFHINGYRFANNDDVVTKVPLPGSYRHVGNMKYIDSEGNILDAPSLWMRAKANFLKMVKNMLNLGLLKLRGQLPQNSLTDHAPIYYAVHIWNDYDKHRPS